MWLCALMSGVEIFVTFLVVRSGKNRRYPACIARSRDNIDGKYRAPRRKSIRSIEVNYWRFA